jgi:hypothetical protein
MGSQIGSMSFPEFPKRHCPMQRPIALNEGKV